MYTQPYQQGGQRPSQKLNPSVVNSLLVADCGAVFTKVSLFGLVEGQYRLMARGEAPTTTASPQEDITSGIIQAVNTIEVITGRHLITNKRIVSPEQSDGNGVDAFMATISAGGPLRLVLLGEVNQTLESLTTQAISGLYIQMQTLPAPSSVGMTVPSPEAVGVGASPYSTNGSPGNNGASSQDRSSMEWEHQLAALQELQPHAALIVGMADGPAGPKPLQEACQLLANVASQGAAPPNKSTSVLYAGAPQYVDATRRMLTGISDVTRVDSLMSPSQLGPISIAIGTLHEQNVIQQLPGYQTLLSWSASTPIATATSLSSLVRFLAQHYAMNVTAIDVGGATTTVMLAGEQGEFIPMVNAGVGVGPGLGSVLEQAGIQSIVRWLPFRMSEQEVHQFVLNHMQQPHMLPTSRRELLLNQAFAREAIRLTYEAAQKNSGKLPSSDLILATGGVLSHAPKYGQVAMMLLDALQPRGVTSLVLDVSMLTPLLGAVASAAPVTAVQVNENDAVTHRLGTCIIPFGELQPGQLAVRADIEYSNGRQISVDVMAGSIEVIPLKLNEQALLSLFPSSTVDVGLGPGERARAAEEIDGGLVGLIIDARGRPLVLPSDETERHARLLQWAQAVGA